MVKLTSSPYFKSFMGALVVLSFAFLSALAVANPVCTHCTMVIAHRAMLGATYLAGGWMIAGLFYCWDYRGALSNQLKQWTASLRLQISTIKKI